MIPDTGPTPDLTTLAIYFTALTLLTVIITVFAVVTFRAVLGSSRDSGSES